MSYDRHESSGMEKEGVTYTALALNEQGVERAKKYSPPLTEVDGDWPWHEPFFPKPPAITNQDGQ